MSRRGFGCVLFIFSCGNGDEWAANECVWQVETIDILSAVDSRVPAIVSQYLNNVPANRVY